jgi:hypothetical protein
MTQIFTFVTVIDIEGTTQEQAQAALEASLNAFLDSDDNMDAESAALACQVLWPAVQISDPDSFYDELVDPDDEAYDDEAGVSVDAGAGDPDEA